MAQTQELKLSEFSTENNAKIETIIIAGGCFWCIDAVMSRVPGVKKVIVGYIGGQTKNPSYEQVSHTNSGHAEAVAVSFDPNKVSREKLMDIFFKAHDPTSLNRQGYDEGTQYRSALFPLSKDQESFYKSYLAKAQKNYTKPIVTTVEAYTQFWKAEEYHQQYFEKNPNQGYCAAVIKPKLEKLQMNTKPLVELIK